MTFSQIQEDLDAIQNGELDEEISKYVLNLMIPQLFKIWADRRFYKIDIKNQTIINSIHIFWMFRRLKHLKDCKIANLAILERILSDEIGFHATTHISPHLKDIETSITEQNEIIKFTLGLSDEVMNQKYTLEPVGTYPPYLLNSINYFIRFGGMESILGLLDDEKNTSIKDMNTIIQIVKSFKKYS
jgi:hypothetical protein